LPAGALVAVVRYVSRREPDPRPQAGKETVALGQLVKRVDGGAPEHAKGASLRLDRVIGQPAENRVKQIEARATQPSVGARAARRAHYFGAVAPRGDERGDDFGRVLQIRVHRHDGICAARVCEASGERGLEAEVARELDELEARVARRLRADERGGIIATAVIDEHGAPGAVALRIEQRGEPREQVGQHRVLVEHRDDDGDDGGGHS
jgi:hypothetical protein